MDQTQPVAPSATPDPTPEPTALEQAIATGDMAHYKAARRAEQSGTPLSPTTPADAAPAKPVEQAEERLESSPESDPGKAAGHKGNADTRKAELQREIRELLAERARLRAEQAQRDERGRFTPQGNADPASQPAPAEPRLEDFEGKPDQYPDPYAAFVEARAVYRAEQALDKKLSESKARAEQEATQRTYQERATAYAQKLDKAFGEDASLADAIDFALFDAHPASVMAPGQAGPQNDLAEALLDADNPAALMKHLTAHPEIHKRLMGVTHPRELYRLIGRLEGELSAPPREAPKTITDAPPPPRTVGTRQSESADPVESAVQSGDMRAFKAARFARR